MFQIFTLNLSIYIKFFLNFFDINNFQLFIYRYILSFIYITFVVYFNFFLNINKNIILSSILI